MVNGINFNKIIIWNYQINSYLCLIKSKQMNKIRNTVEDKIIFEGDDRALVEFVQKIAIENEDYQFSVLGYGDAYEYITDYCDNLELIESE